MKLSDVFTGRKNTDTVDRLQKASPSTSRTASINRQIRALVPGQTLHGEIVSRNGSEVQIRLSEDFVISARVDQNMNLEVGKNMTFEVKNNGSALTLSPLFANVATDVNVLKALDMAGLSVNQTSVSMTEQMMEAGLAVDRNSLQQMYREINAFPDAEISDIVNLHKLGLPVNEETVNQMVSYRNLTHQLVQGMETVMDALPNVVEELTVRGDLEGAVTLYRELVQLAEESLLPEEADFREALPTEAETSASTVSGTAEDTVSFSGTVLQENNVENGEALPKAEPGAGETEIPAGRGMALAEELQEAVQEQENAQALRHEVTEELRQVLSNLNLSPRERTMLQQQIDALAGEEGNPQKMLALIDRIGETAGRDLGGAKEALQSLFSQKGVQTFLLHTLRDSWLIRPREVSEPGKVEELYRRLDKQLKGLTHALESVGQKGSEAYRAASNMSQNVDFLHQLNQMYSYVQLPLRLQQGAAHGDLYVYSNRKNLAGKDGKVSALLHLDMEHLGPVEVYVALQNSKVNTRFFVKDDEMLDFLEAHMDLLTDRLKKRGYDYSFSMETRGEESHASQGGGLAPILEQEKGVVLTQYAFDVRT